MDKEGDENILSFMEDIMVACVKTIKNMCILSFDLINPYAILRKEHRYRKTDFSTNYSLPLTSAGVRSINTCIVRNSRKNFASSKT